MKKVPNSVSRTATDSSDKLSLSPISNRCDDPTRDDDYYLLKGGGNRKGHKFPFYYSTRGFINELNAFRGRSESSNDTAFGKTGYMFEAGFMIGRVRGEKVYPVKTVGRG